MKFQHLIFTVLVIFLAVETQGGVIENIFGKVTNTTNALKQDVRNVWTYSKNVVGIETPADNRTEEEKRGFIGGILHTTKEKVHNVRNYFWNTDANANDAGLFGNMFNRVTNTLTKVKGSLLGNNPTPTHPRPPSDSEKMIQEALNKLFFKNGTRHEHGKAFQEAINNLKNKLEEIKRNHTKTTESPIHHGEGLLDVRVGHLSAEDVNDNSTSNNEV